MTPMIVRATPWLRWWVSPNSSIRSRTCWTCAGVVFGFSTMIIAVLGPGPIPGGKLGRIGNCSDPPRRREDLDIVSKAARARRGVTLDPGMMGGMSRVAVVRTQTTEPGRRPKCRVPAPRAVVWVRTTATPTFRGIPRIESYTPQDEPNSEPVRRFRPRDRLRRGRSRGRGSRGGGGSPGGRAGRRAWSGSRRNRRSGPRSRRRWWPGPSAPGPGCRSSGDRP